MRGHAALTSSALTTGRDDWQTPEVVLERVRRVGCLALDPCTSSENPCRALRWCYLGAPMHAGSWPYGDGLAFSWYLALNWGDVVFVNPPYSAMAAWADKVASEAEVGTPIVALVAARTETKWWERMWSMADACAYWRRRLAFNLPGIATRASATFPSALLAFNVGARRFRTAFEDRAAVVAVP